MASLDVSGIDKYTLDLLELEDLPDSVVEEMVEAGGEVIREAQSASALAMLAGPYNEGAVQQSPKLGKVKRTQDGKAIYVTFDGKQHGVRLAEIAFINEYGKHGQPARPFIRTANEKSAEAANDAAAKVYDRYLKSKGF